MNWLGYDDQTVFDGRLAAKLYSNFVEHASKYTSDRSDLTATLKVAVFVANNVENVGIGSAPPRAFRVERVAGNSFNIGTEMMTVADMSVLEVRVDVGENDIVKIEIGDSADVEVDAYNNRKFKGEFLEVFTASPQEFFSWCRDGQVTDGKTLAAGLWLQNTLSGNWPLSWRDHPVDPGPVEPL